MEKVAPKFHPVQGLSEQTSKSRTGYPLSEMMDNETHTDQLPGIQGIKLSVNLLILSSNIIHQQIQRANGGLLKLFVASFPSQLHHRDSVVDISPLPAASLFHLVATEHSRP
ncbi:hypothetical protein HAX54_041170 [Datura stramonium]|uniref:Uncharacterized protein n=1 Tax=Datura stramonium TaxID=4076 RepID=A0ABS8SKR3_DATST|nr:hypothetical protein [Datura stramonium]